MGFALLAALSLLAALAALAVTVRARLRGRAEEVVAATLLANAIIILPIYALGLTGHLTARALAVASVATSVATFAAASAGVGALPLLRQAGRIALGILRLPADALALSWRARSLVFVGVAFAALLLPYLAVTSYLAQQPSLWDPLWYHDSMVGFAIQNHGFAMVDLPPTLQKVNGYVRLGEMTQLWMVIFADRRLGDLTNLLFAPAIAASVYVLARRHAPAAPRHTAVGWGVAVLLMPACASLLHSTYVDPQNAALLLGGIVFGTLRSPRLRDTWLAALGLALAIGSKGLSLVPVPVAGLVAAVLVLRAHGGGSRRNAALATIAGGLLLIAGTASITYVRNYRAFHNPFWPDLSVEIRALGIHWPGQGPWATEAGRPGQPVNLNEPLPRLFDHLLALPWSIKGMYFDQAVDYGIGISWIAIPLGIVAFVACLVAALRRALRRDGVPAGSEEAPPPLGVALILASMVAGSPALWGPRYHIAAIGLLFTLCAWFTGRPSRERLGESAIAAIAVTSLMMFWWAPAPRWWRTPSQLAALAHASPTAREVDRDLGAPTPLAAGLAREKELGPGTTLVFTDHYSGFPSLFWNNHFSNRVVYMRDGSDFLDRAANAGAAWIFLNDHNPALLAQARRPGSGWQEVGMLNPINAGYAFRKVAVKPPPPAPAPPPAPPRTPPAPPAAPIVWHRR